MFSSYYVNDSFCNISINIVMHKYVHLLYLLEFCIKFTISIRTLYILIKFANIFVPEPRVVIICNLEVIFEQTLIKMHRFFCWQALSISKLYLQCSNASYSAFCLFEKYTNAIIYTRICLFSLGKNYKRLTQLLSTGLNVLILDTSLWCRG